ncbi:MAG TPA: LuxR C-terminal-related transcriptional regulator [Candidatus Dormibacteraeota bacterium]|nr:LuxR C-terminal-related transcriptional regulator [Candidatus Dormibacteraeota bacterium]
MARGTRRGRPPHDDLLTPTEWRVVHAVQHGLSNRQIAARRGISLDAVKYHVANAVAKLGLANRQALRRWFRAPRDSALARTETTQMNPIALGPLAQIARTVRDIKESEAFYGTQLGLPHLYSFGALAFFDCGGTRLYLQAQPEPAAESILYLRVADVRAAYELLLGRGVPFRDAPHLIHRHADGTEEWMAHFSDPEGRPLAILSQVRP